LNRIEIFDRVELSDNPFDQEKDIIAYKDDKEFWFEVKTQVPFFTEESISVEEKQIPKMRNVDGNFVLIIPDPSGQFSQMKDYAGKLIYLESEFRWKPKRVKGRSMALITVHQKSVRIVESLDIETIRKAQSLSVSELAAT